MSIILKKYRKFVNGGDIQPPSKKPTTSDSLTLYKNSLEIRNYYKSPIYKLMSREQIKKDSDHISAHEVNDKKADELRDILRTGFTPATQNAENDNTFKYNDYHKDENSNVYYQREGHYGIMDTRAPMTRFDRRIEPQERTIYGNVSNNSLKGDVVEMYGYDPIAVKPWNTLTPDERKERIAKYGYPPIDNTDKKPSTTSLIKQLPIAKRSQIQDPQTVIDKPNITTPTGGPSSPLAGGPTNFSFTGRDDAGQQTTRYFSDIDTWKAATDQMGYRWRDETNNGKEAHASGYQFENGGPMNTIFRKYQQVLNKRKLAGGGVAGSNLNVNPYQIGAQLGVGLINQFSPPDELGFQSTSSEVGKDALSGAATGAAIGSVVPVVGTAAGAVAGAVVGGTYGYLKGKLNERKERDLRGTIATNNRINETSQSNAILGQNPELASGFANSSYFKDGGTMGRYVKCATGGTMGPMPNRSPLNDLITSGGKAKQLSSDNAEIIGNTHAQGGVQIPGLDSEVEGGETTKDNFVFSKALGFAKMHKPIARAKGIIEKKVQTKERVNSMKRLAERENELAEQQEMFKQQNGMQ